MDLFKICSKDEGHVLVWKRGCFQVSKNEKKGVFFVCLVFFWLVLFSINETKAKTNIFQIFIVVFINIYGHVEFSLWICRQCYYIQTCMLFARLVL